MNITTIGLDIAKNVFQVHGVAANGKVVLRKQLKRSQVLAFFANLLACRVNQHPKVSTYQHRKVSRWVSKIIVFQLPFFVV